MRTNDGSLILGTRVDGKFIERSYMFYSKKEAYQLFRQHVKDVLSGNSNDYSKDIFAEFFNDWKEHNENIYILRTKKTHRFGGMSLFC